MQLIPLYAIVPLTLSLLPNDEVRKYQNAFKWLIDEFSTTDIFITAFISVLTSGSFAEPFAEL
ncbi:hypothetical protein CHX27_00375 [Flavobacterium aurantiibacter]|uniref:Uncharacterized protein n=1 Tax=Flavobacterium aurantiibacter TaxID=2023067 RepID=A0A256AC72_9FLAO|nr:hypothetical protein CHX27_00375 [Flavobacterium aurantiibacter]